MLYILYRIFKLCLVTKQICLLETLYGMLVLAVQTRWETLATSVLAQ